MAVTYLDLGLPRRSGADSDGEGLPQTLLTRGVPLTPLQRELRREDAQLLTERGMTPDERLAHRAVERFRGSLDSAWGKYQPLELQDALDGFQDFAVALDNSRDKELASVSGEARKILKPVVDRLHLEGTKVGLEHWHRQNGVVTQLIEQARVERAKVAQASVDALLGDLHEAQHRHDDPDELQRVAERSAAEWQQVGQRNGWSEQQLGQQLAQWDEKLYGVAIAKHLDKDDVAGARTVLADVQHRLTPDTADRLNATIDAGEQRIQAQRNAATGDGNIANTAEGSKTRVTQVAQMDALTISDVPMGTLNNQSDQIAEAPNDEIAQNKNTGTTQSNQPTITKSKAGTSVVRKPVVKQITQKGRVMPADERAEEFLNNVYGGAIGYEGWNIGHVRYKRTEDWDGRGRPSWRGFETVISPEYGTRMAYRNVATKIADMTTESPTPRNIGRTWLDLTNKDPNKRDNLEVWLKNIRLDSGIGPDDNLDLDDTNQMTRFLRAMHVAEQGDAAKYPLSVYIDGINMSKGSPPPEKSFEQRQFEIYTIAMNDRDTKDIRPLIFHKLMQRMHQDRVAYKKANPDSTPISTSDDRFGEIRY